MEKYKNIKWENDFSVNNPVIDEEHKGLLKIYNNIIDSLKDEDKDFHIVNVLTDLTNYSLKHFKSEEDWMLKIQYPDFEPHQRSHKDFIYRIAMFNLSYNPEDTEMLFEILSFLRLWIIDHLKTCDKKIALYKIEIEK